MPSRVDMMAIERQFGASPTDPREQNRLWYKIYKTVEEKVAVTSVHKDYLFYRDYSCIAVLVTVLAPLLMAWRGLAFETCLIVECGLLIQFLLVRNAAYRTGRRFVASVMAAAA